jgi:hypothetical protein
MAARRGFNRRDFDLGHKLRLVDGEHDVFGDGSVVCLPTHAVLGSKLRKSRETGRAGPFQSDWHYHWWVLCCLGSSRLNNEDARLCRSPNSTRITR